MKEVTYEMLKEEYPMLYNDFSCYVHGGLCNLLIAFNGYEYEELFEGMNVPTFKETIKEMKAKYKDEIIRFLDEFGLENGGEWFYYEYLDVEEDETIDTNCGCFGVTMLEDMGDGKTNFHEKNMFVHELLQDVKGL